MKRVVVLIALVALVSGCSFFTKTPTQMDTALVQSAVQSAAVAEAVSHPELKTQMIAISAMVVQDINSGSFVSLPDVNNEIGGLLAKSGLSPADQQAAQIFLAGMTPVLNAYIQQSTGNSTAGVPVQVCMFAQWVNNALGDTATCKNQIVITPAATTGGK